MSKVIIFSGAGVSAESGISTFRDNGGLWDKYRVEEICTEGCLETNRDATIDFYDARRKDLKDKVPNYAHILIAKLKEKYPKEIAIITQNVDDMFEKAGCKEIIHLHGFMREIRCEKCGLIEDIGYEAQDKAHKNCPTCKATMRPNIVFFNESAPKYEEMYDELDDCKMLVVIGTSGAVINTDSFLSSKIKVSILNNLEPSKEINHKNYTNVLFKPATQAISEIAIEIEKFLAKKHRSKK